MSVVIYVVQENAIFKPLSHVQVLVPSTRRKNFVVPFSFLFISFPIRHFPLSLLCLKYKKNFGIHFLPTETFRPLILEFALKFAIYQHYWFSQSCFSLISCTSRKVRIRAKAGASTPCRLARSSILYRVAITLKKQMISMRSFYYLLYYVFR